MADELKCKCGADKDKMGQPFTTASFRVHILQEARKDGKGIHGWPSTKEFPNPPEVTTAVIPALPAAEIAAPTVDLNDDSDLVFGELDQLRGFFNVLRSELDALKEKVERPAEVWADAVKPVPVDQEAVNLAQMNAVLGIDQPGPLDRKEEELLTAVEARLETDVVEVADPETEAAVQKEKGLPRGVFLILAFVAVVGVVVLWIIQT